MNARSPSDRLAELENFGDIDRKLRSLDPTLDLVRNADLSLFGVGAHDLAYRNASAVLAAERVWNSTSAMHEHVGAGAVAHSARMQADIAAEIERSARAVALLKPPSELDTLRRESMSVGESLRRAGIAGAEIAAQRAAMLQGPSGLARDFAAHAAAHSARAAAMEAARQFESGIAAYAASYKLPEVSEVSRLYADAMRGAGIGQSLANITSAGQLDRALREMSRPWMSEIDPVRSVRGFIEMQGLGGLLSRVAQFSVEASAAYRSVLGDWRDTALFSSSMFSDIEQRAALYRSLGFDSALTDMPDDAFAQSVRVARIDTERPAMISIFAPPVAPSDDDEQEDGFARTNNAHDWLQRFETQVRRFIAEQMRAAFGEDWPKHRLPNGMYERWDAKRKAAGHRAEAIPLVAFADFTDYLPIIEKRDNWREVFKVFFERPEGVRESFQRLYPIRIDTMHARLITSEDEVFLYVEVRRIVRAITRH